METGTRLTHFRLIFPLCTLRKYLQTSGDTERDVERYFSEDKESYWPEWASSNTEDPHKKSCKKGNRKNTV